MPNLSSSALTKKNMIASLKKLMKKKPLHKISVREITEDCGVNRQTFYYHFQDIYDMVKWMYQQEALVLLAEHDNILLWQDGLLRLFHYLDDNREVCLCALNSVSHAELKRMLYDDVHDILKRVIVNIGRDLPNVKEEYVEFLTHFYTLSLASMVESWLAGGVSQTPEELIAMIDTTLTDHMNGAIARINGEN